MLCVFTKYQNLKKEKEKNNHVIGAKVSSRYIMKENVPPYPAMF